MRPSLYPFSLALLAITLPVLAGADARNVYRWPSEYQALPIAGGVKRSYVVTQQQSEIRDVPIGFTYSLGNSERYTTLNIGAKGYITFGASNADRSNPRQPGIAGEPRNFIAAWWGDHFCDPNNISTQLATVDNQRYFIVEWKNCRRNSLEESGAARFSAQIWLAEGPQQFFRVYYGPNTLHTEAEGDWKNVRVGFEMDQRPVNPGDPPPAPLWRIGLDCANGGTGCRSDDFPSGYAYQYLPWSNRPDMTGNVRYVRSPDSLQVSGQQVSFQVTGESINIGNSPAENVVREFWLSPSRRIDSSSIRLKQEVDLPNPFPGNTSQAFTSNIAFNLSQLPNFGNYYVCVRHEVRPQQQPGETQAEFARRQDADSTNNDTCEDLGVSPMRIGPDLTGTVTLHTSSSHLLGTAEVSVTIQNVGNVATPGPVKYWVHFGQEVENLRPVMQPSVDGNSQAPWPGNVRYLLNWGGPGAAVPAMTTTPNRWNWDYEHDPENYDLHEGTIGTSIPKGGHVQVNNIQVKLPRFLWDGNQIETKDRGKWRAVLEVASSWPNPAYDGSPATVDFHIDPNPSNNLAASTAQVALKRPRLEISDPNLVMPIAPHTDPDGCVYGESVTTASFKICNVGEHDAYGFHPGILLGGPGNAVPDDDPWIATLLKSCSPEVAEAARMTPQEVCGTPDESICYMGFCRDRCNLDSDCPKGFACLVDLDLKADIKTCVAKLEVDACHVYELREGGMIPFEPAFGDPFQHGEEMAIWGMANPTNRVVEEVDPPAQRQLNDPAKEMYCYMPLQEYEAVSLDVPPTLIAGDTYRVRRVIQNIGFRDSPARDGVRYGFFLSATPFVSEKQWLLPVQGSVDGLGQERGLRRRYGNAVGVSDRTDAIVVPDYIPPGKRYLGMVIDPHDAIEEYDKSNNVIVAEVEVKPPVLQIRSRTLPVARVGVKYHWSMWATGGVGAYEWSADGLPAWLSFSKDGIFEGIPTETGDHVINVAVRSSDMVVWLPVALQVRHAEGPLSIAMDVLPPAVNGKDYSARLTANGGVPPYQWRLAAGRLPTGLVLNEAGEISGRTADSARSATVTFEVRDRLGATASREATVLAVRDSNLRITGSLIPGVTGSPFTRSCLLAEGGDTSGTYEWTVEPSSLPKGIQVTDGVMPNQSQVCFEGTPVECGLFLVDIQVQDAQGQRASSSFPLDLQCGQLTLIDPELRPLRRGAGLDVDLQVRGFDQVNMRLHQGVLPAGIQLSEEGRLFGKVADDADFGTYDFIVELSDAQGRYGLGALSLVVLTERQSVTSKDEGGGCAVGGSSSSAPFTLALAFLGVLLGRRRRSGGAAGAGAGAPPAPARKAGARWVGLAATVALLSAGVLACGDDAKSGGLCPENACSEFPNTTCDPVDGICKCGSDGNQIVCKQGEVCVNDTSPRCIATACEGVPCDRGQTCDPADGICKCSGEICEEGQVCYQGSCQAEQNCAGVVCAAGMSCDPVDGTCKCGEEACEVGERCDDGVCVEDPCSGVHCGANTTCNPSDRLCHCGGVTGELCAPGQGCVSDEGVFRCTNIDLCADNTCSGRTICDPLDGSCRCGGIGPEFPICNPDQVCQDGVCVGGDLCTGVVCDTGLACDPFDGQCKCGGERGTVCESDETCTLIGGTYSCARSCDLTQQDCGQGAGCYVDLSRDSAKVPFCAPEGQAAEGGDCSSPVDCRAGQFCRVERNRCYEFCDPSRPNSCSKPFAVCVPIEGTNAGYCIDDS